MANFKVTKVSQAVLVWARESARLTQEEAAKKLEVRPLDIQYWEDGGEEHSPTLAQLRRMADVYRRPLAVFLLPEPPDGFDVIRNFRLLPQNQERSWSRSLEMEFRRVQMQREVALELAEREGDDLVDAFLTLSVDDNEEQVAERIRQWLGPIAPQDHDAYRREFLQPWISIIEAKSILVTQVSGVKFREMRGCSISSFPYPAIILNGVDSERGRLFTLLHELVHILLHNGGVCDLGDRQTLQSIGTVRLERFCNAVGAAVLIPRTQLLRDRSVAFATANSTWSDQDLERLANLFGVSQEAMLLRLVGLGRSSWGHYFDKQSQFHDYADRSDTEEKKKGGPGPYRLKIRNFGPKYVRSVLNAYQRRDITGSELSDYLQIKLNHLPTLELRLGKR